MRHIQAMTLLLALGAATLSVGTTATSWAQPAPMDEAVDPRAEKLLNDFLAALTAKAGQSTFFPANPRP